MFALKLLTEQLGSPNIDCRQDGAKLDPALGRATYLFNSTIAGIDQAVQLLKKSGAQVKSVPVPLLAETEDAGNQIAHLPYRFGS